ncbi:MAG: trimethylamine methyltransferase family protein, partial [Anaerovoracaceae bacterium]
MAKKERKAAGILDTIKCAQSYGNKLTQDELYAIHAASLEVLSQVGIKVESQKARKIFEEGGATIEGEFVKIPPHVVEECIRS